jgi:hypothetical protein
MTLPLPSKYCHQFQLKNSWIILRISNREEDFFAGYSRFIYPWNGYLQPLCEGGTNEKGIIKESKMKVKGTRID